MKDINILCEIQKLEEAKGSLAAIFGRDCFLQIRLSKKGKAPATHAYSFYRMNDADYQRLLAGHLHCTVEEGPMIGFLKMHSLRIVEE